MKENVDVNKFVEDLAEKVGDEVEKKVDEVTKTAVREVEIIVVEEVLTWYQALKSWFPTSCYRPRQIENPSLAKPEETPSTQVD
jgi:hypothetical protein